jgi:hypothetical protein
MNDQQLVADRGRENHGMVDVGEAAQAGRQRDRCARASMT